MSESHSAAAALPLRRLNVPFLAAFAIVVAAYAAAFLLLQLLIPIEQMAGTLAALVLGSGAYVQQAIERRLRVPPGPVVTRAGYLKPWYVLLALSLIAVWAAQSTVPYVQLRGGPLTTVVSSIDSLLRILGPATATLVGVIVAQRSDRFALGVALAAVLGGWLLNGVTYGLVVGFATGSEMPPTAPPGVEMPPNPVPYYFGDGLVAYLLTGQLPLLIAGAMLGYWYGTRTRLQAYLGGLLREVGTEDREAIVELAYDAARARNEAGTHGGSGS